MVASLSPLLRLALLLGVFALGAWAHASGLLRTADAMRGDLAYLVRKHLELVALSGGAAILVGVPLGIVLSRSFARPIAAPVMQLLNIGTSIPTLAKLALAMTFLGIGNAPALLGLFIVSLLPIVQNTVAGHRAVPAHLIEAAVGMGMTPVQTLLHVELPNALFVILAGIRTALAINVGTAPLAFLIGGTSLGELIFTGIALNDMNLLLIGAGSTAALAILVDAGVGRVQRVAVSRGVNPFS